MRYADFSYYREIFCGDVIDDEDEYLRLSIRAGIELEAVTFGRSADCADNDSVKMAACAVAELLATAHRTDVQLSSGNEIQSETVGGFSRTYRSGAERADRAKKDVYMVIAKYLSNTGLMYRGV